MFLEAVHCWTRYATCEAREERESLWGLVPQQLTILDRMNLRKQIFQYDYYASSITAEDEEMDMILKTQIRV